MDHLHNMERLFIFINGMQLVNYLRSILFFVILLRNVKYEKDLIQSNASIIINLWKL